MDVISLGVANQAYSSEEKTRYTVLGPGVTGQFANVKSRIDSLDKAIAGITDRANQLIVNDAINIMKANAKLNVVAKSMRYKHQNMIFDDLLDASGIDASKSSGYTLDTTNGLVKPSGTGPATIVTIQEVADTVPQEAVLMVEEQVSNTIPVSLMPTMKSDTTPAPYTLSGPEFPGQEIWKMFDGNVLTTWHPGNNVSSASIYVTLPQPDWLHQITVKDNSSWPPTTLSVYGFNPSTSTYEFIASFSGINNITLSLNPSKPYAQYKLTFGTSGSNFYVGELGLYKLVSPSDKSSYFISRDDGVTWEQIIPEQLFYFTAKSPQDKRIRLKAVLPPGVSLLNYGLTWV